MRNTSLARSARAVRRSVFLLALASTIGCSDDDSREGPGSSGARDPAQRETQGASTDDGPLFQVPDPLPSLGAVWGSAADDVWAVGTDGVILHFDGTQWTPSEGASKASLHGVHGSAPDNVWAVGAGVIQRWDGSSWSLILETEHEALLAVWAVAPDDVWIAGIETGSHHGLLRHWDGKDFQGGVFNTVASVWELWGAAPDDVWMAGSSVENTGFVARGNIEGISPSEFSGASLRGIWGLGVSDIWFLPYQGAFEHWDGETFTQYDTDPDAKWLGMFGTSASDIWAVGLNGIVMHFDGEAWTRTPNPSEATLWSVWAAAPDDAWAVGGTLLHWNGERWRDMAPSKAEEP